MKALRIVGLLGVLAAVLSGVGKPARATGITCQYYCSGERHIATCYGTLSQCCNWIQSMCPDPYVYEGGGCDDGVNYC